MATAGRCARKMWPGNTADVGSLIPVIDRLRKRFCVNRVCVVADRGMISAETLAELEARDMLYILGVRERTDKLVRELVLDDPAPFVPFFLTRRGYEVDYEAKAVTLAGRRYIVCCNHDEARKDAADRAGHPGWARKGIEEGRQGAGRKQRAIAAFSKTPTKAISSSTAPRSKRTPSSTGSSSCATNARLSPLEAMLVYKHLWTVERTFRTSKSLFETRPIDHKLDETIRGHVSCSFLALVLKKELEDRIAALAEPAAKGNAAARLMARHSGRPRLPDRDRNRTGRQAFPAALAPRPAASLALRAAGVALPPTVRQLADA